jgi:hypothetical protein
MLQPQGCGWTHARRATPLRTTQAGQSALLLLDTVEILSRERFDYAVVGAFALAVHGAVRASTDVDALLRDTPEQLKQLDRAFKEAGFRTALRQGHDEDPVWALWS